MGHLVSPTVSEANREGRPTIMGAGLHTLWLEAKDRLVAVLGLDERWLPLETKIKIPNIHLDAYS
jgi:hypothetical protein